MNPPRGGAKVPTSPPAPATTSPAALARVARTAKREIARARRSTPLTTVAEMPPRQVKFQDSEVHHGQQEIRFYAQRRLAPDSGARHHRARAKEEDAVGPSI